jgi:hypothetical protein
LGEIISSIFRKDDVEVVQNKTDEKFGVAPLSKALLWVCLEVKRDFNLDQAAFQSMVSGESVAIRMMHKEPYTVVFKTPGLMCGNEPMSYVDNSTSVSRRIVMITFYKTIEGKTKDPTIKKKFAMEMDLVLYKIAKAYKEAVEVHGHRDFWGLAEAKVVPAYFLEARRALMESTHCLATFLHSTDKLVFDNRTDIPSFVLPTEWRRALADGRIFGMPFKVFKELAKEFFVANLSPKEFASFGWRPKDYESVMENFGIRVVDLDKPIMYLDNEPYGGKWVVNCSESSHVVELDLLADQLCEDVERSMTGPIGLTGSAGPSGPTGPIGSAGPTGPSGPSAFSARSVPESRPVPEPVHDDIDDEEDPFENVIVRTNKDKSKARRIR